MAKQLQRTYVFTPGVAGAGTIQIPGKFDLSQLLVITNVTKNQIIYNFADLNYIGTTVSFSRANTTQFPQALGMSEGVTTITLGYSTSGMSSSDILQIFTERADGAILTRAMGAGTDAWERQRTSNPKSMIDADFEYGLQPTKWQQISMVRGYPGIYEIPGSDVSLASITTNANFGYASDISADSLITVNTVNPHNFSAGNPLVVTGLDTTVASFALAQGSFIVNSVINSNSFTYYARGKVGVSSGTVVNSTYTVLRQAGFYTGASRSDVSFSVISGGTAGTTATIQVSFSAGDHGLLPGSGIMVVVSSDNGTNNHSYAQGPFVITSVTSVSSFTYQARSAVGAITGTIGGELYARSDSFYVHRAYDGGVQLGTGGFNYGAAAIRQSKKYMRYQSGKAINFNTGLLMAPNYQLRSVTATNTIIGSSITAVCDLEDHNFQVGAVVKLENITSSGYSGTYSVASIIDSRTFTVTATSVLSTTNPVLGTPCYVSLINWYGSTIRAGTFDEQNGLFWQYDGQQISVGIRIGVTDMGGLANISPDSVSVTGQNSRWYTQLIAGDKVVLRGMTHHVSRVVSDTNVHVTSDWRAATTSTGVRMMKVLERIVPQSQWNMDRCDGSGSVYNPSGYNILVNKMQMAGIQWTWYGAGFVDFMLRGPDGNYITAHRMRNNNINNEAYMRTGNMPVRYEVINEGARAGLAVNMGSADTVMTVTDVTFFPSSGIVYVDNEIISYNGVTTSTNTLNNLVRGTSITQFISNSNKTLYAGGAVAHYANSGTGVLLYGQTAAPNISHWGSAFIQDGGFDDDRGYLFNYSATNIQISTRKTTLFAIRLAPSVSNAIAGDLGVRDLINRAQFLLQSIEVSAGGSSNVNSAIVIEAVLNPINYPSTQNITWYTLNGGVNISPISNGQPSFSQIAPGTLMTFTNYTLLSNLSVTGSPGAGTTVLTVSTSSIQIGDAVYPTTTSSTAIAGGTFVQSIGAGTITLNNPLVGTLNANINISRSAYALPGETIFSFVTSVANRDTLDLSSLKEMTNTPVGGRSCYPNGPDCLFINAYLTQGTPIYANVVLRWGEAQA
jgi:hypothetical protein